MKDKHVKKYMRLAKKIGEDNNPCYSRQIGVVIVDPAHHKIIGTGYNGPPRETPHCDEPAYLKDYLFPLLTLSDKEELGVSSDEELAAKYSGCQKCPRRLLGIPSGERMELCSCVHAEANAIINAGTDLYGSVMFAWCPMPCIECTKLIVNSGIKKIFCLDSVYTNSQVGAVYFLLEQANISIYKNSKEFYLDDVQ